MVSPLRGMHTVLFDLDGTLLDTYELLVRAVRGDGRISPEPARVTLDISSDD